ncbi:MAG: NPCBM/NEW2 domain-containing protein [Thermoguttaceae bacterium]
MRVASQSLALSLALGLLLAAAPRAARGAETVWLTSLDLKKMTQGWGDPQIDHSVTKTPLVLAGRHFAHGVGTHAPSTLWIDLGGGADRFLATVGINDSAGAGDGVIFKISGDGKTLFQSGVMKLGQPPQTVDIDIKGVKTLVLAVKLVNTAGNAHADWADAHFLVSGAKPRAIDFPFEKGVILTPPAPLTPRINGAKIFGVRPGSPFFFTIPATGQRPMTFAVENLPAGLSVDARSGYISGKLDKPGRYAVVFQATNALGMARRGFTIVCGDTLALTPEMGWNSWYYWTGGMSDKVMRDAADAMVASGMINHGYIYVNIDDCWAGPRDAAGKVISDARFPDMKAMTDYIHHRGLRAGIYTSPGPATCAGRTGAFQHEEQDVQRFVEWGFDFLKYDWCSYSTRTPGLAGSQEPYRKMSALLKKQPRDIVFNLCQGGGAEVWKWGKDAGGNSWRTADDLGRGFSSGQFDMIGREVFDHYAKNEIHKYGGPGGWNDPDYLQLGYLNPGRTRMSPGAQYSHVSLWALVAAPLIFAGDITRLDDFTLNLLCNDEVIEVDQDPLGKPGWRVAKDGDTEVWVRPLEDGSLAVGLFNRGDEQTTVTAKWSDLGVHGKQRGRDLWRQKDLGTLEGQYSAPVPGQGVLLLRLCPAKE